jgi:hypothetical protein
VDLPVASEAGRQQPWSSPWEKVPTREARPPLADWLRTKPTIHGTRSDRTKKMSPGQMLASGIGIIIFFCIFFSTSSSIGGGFGFFFFVIAIMAIVLIVRAVKSYMEGDE